jgi:hypothetical protein
VQSCCNPNLIVQQLVFVVTISLLTLDGGMAAHCMRPQCEGGDVSYARYTRGMMLCACAVDAIVVSRSPTCARRGKSSLQETAPLDEFHVNSCQFIL